MDPATLADHAKALAKEAARLADKAAQMSGEASELVTSQTQAGGDPFIFLFTVFVLAVFVGFYVVWSVTPALHSPLMSVTNAISSVIIVGGLIAVGPAQLDFSTVMGFLAVTPASVNLFGGFNVTQRMVSMFTKKK